MLLPMLQKRGHDDGRKSMYTHPYLFWLVSCFFIQRRHNRLQKLPQKLSVSVFMQATSAASAIRATIACRIEFYYA